MEPLQVGDPETIDGWRLVGRLWSGGSIAAYMATKATMRAELQVVRFDALEPSSIHEAFATEVDRVAALGDGRLPAVLGSSIGDGEAWMAMEYVPGTALSDLVAVRGPLPEDKWLVLADCLIESLNEVHAAGLVHRDVTPASVVYAGDVPRMTGLGIAQVAWTAGLPTAGIFARTLMWLSPEQIEGSESTESSDLFSAGSTLSYAATGRPPWGPVGTPTAEVVDRIVRSAPDAEGVSYEQLRIISALTAKGSSFRSRNLASIGEVPDEGLRSSDVTLTVEPDGANVDGEQPDEESRDADADAGVSDSDDSVAMSSQVRTIPAVMAAMTVDRSGAPQAMPSLFSNRKTLIVSAAIGILIVVLGLLAMIGYRSASDPSQDAVRAPAPSSSETRSPEASAEAAAADVSPTYATQVNYMQGSIPDGSFPGTLEWEFDVCSFDEQLADPKTLGRIALYEVRAGKWARVPAQPVIMNPGRCKEDQVNVTIRATAPAPKPNQIGLGWLDCVKHRVITPETATFAKSYIDFCVRAKADAT
ncbi:MAG: protein kinase [Actinobacteria bacterium]|nr:protein kinase [Actinomycetota bacterium]